MDNDETLAGLRRLVADHGVGSPGDIEYECPALHALSDLLLPAFEVLAVAREALRDHVAGCAEGYCSETIDELDAILARLHERLEETR